jgi:hypothetical protein
MTALALVLLALRGLRGRLPPWLLVGGAAYGFVYALVMSYPFQKVKHLTDPG